MIIDCELEEGETNSEAFINNLKRETNLTDYEIAKLAMKTFNLLGLVWNGKAYHNYID